MNTFGRQPPQGETTRVGLESEVRIPAMMALIGALSVDIAIIGTFLTWLIWLLWQDGGSVAGSWAAAWWGAWVIALLVPWGLFACLLAFSFGVQTIDKHWPAVRKSREADDGLLVGVFGSRRERTQKDDDDEDEW